MRPNAVPLYRPRFLHPPICQQTPADPSALAPFPGGLLGFSGSFFLLCWLLCLLPLPNTLVPRGLAFSSRAPSLEASSLAASLMTPRPRAVGRVGRWRGHWAGVGSCHFSHTDPPSLWCFPNLPRRVSAPRAPGNKPPPGRGPRPVLLCLARGGHSLSAELHSSIQQIFT